MAAGQRASAMANNVTSQDVARLAQVSQSAVSRTFTPGASVSDTTRAKVQVAAKKLGYRPNAIARSLITKRSRMIGVVISQLDNQFYPLVLEKLSQRLQRDGYHVLLFISDSRNADGVLQEILQYQVDGIVMASTVLSSVLAQDCADAGIPVVLFNRVTLQAANDKHPASGVTSDNYHGGQLVARHLANNGYQKIAYIAGLEDSSTSMERERGFCNGLVEQGLRCFARGVGNYSFEGAQNAAHQMFNVDPEKRPDAVFVGSDHMAIAVMDVLRCEMGLRIPQDVAVVGYDNVPQAAWGAYQLTTVEQSIEPMIEATVELLHEQIDSGLSPRSITIPCQIIERKSVQVLTTGAISTPIKRVAV